MIKKYIVWSPGRTGSTLLAQRLATPWLTEHNWEQISYSNHADQADWNCPIQHTHQLDLLRAAPTEYVPIIVTRSLLDTVTSDMIAYHTGIWNISSTDGWRDSEPVSLDCEAFVAKLLAKNYEYTRALHWHKQHAGEKYIVDYTHHIADMAAMCDHLNIDPAVYGSDDIDHHVKKLPQDKFTMIINLAEILQAYQNHYLINNFDDAATIDHVKNLIRNSNESNE